MSALQHIITTYQFIHHHQISGHYPTLHRQKGGVWLPLHEFSHLSAALRASALRPVSWSSSLTSVAGEIPMALHDLRMTSEVTDSQARLTQLITSWRLAFCRQNVVLQCPLELHLLSPLLFYTFCGLQCPRPGLFLCPLLRAPLCFPFSVIFWVTVPEP